MGEEAGWDKNVVNAVKAKVSAVAGSVGGNDGVVRLVGMAAYGAPGRYGIFLYTAGVWLGVRFGDVAANLRTLPDTTVYVDGHAVGVSLQDVTNETLNTYVPEDEDPSYVRPARGTAAAGAPVARSALAPTSSGGFVDSDVVDVGGRTVAAGRTAGPVVTLTVLPVAYESAYGAPPKSSVFVGVKAIPGVNCEMVTTHVRVEGAAHLCWWHTVARSVLMAAAMIVPISGPVPLGHLSSRHSVVGPYPLGRAGDRHHAWITPCDCCTAVREDILPGACPPVRQLPRDDPLGMGTLTKLPPSYVRRVLRLSELACSSCEEGPEFMTRRINFNT